MNFKFKLLIVASIGILLGATGGFAMGYSLSKKKYLSKADEEIKSVREMFDKHIAPPEKPAEPQSPESPEVEHEPIEQPSIMENERKEYVAYSKMYDGGEQSAAPAPKKKPYEIPATEFGEKVGYETVSLVYYADKVLADDDENVLTNLKNYGGAALLGKLSPENDAVYVRDDSIRTDYEILYSERSYSKDLKA